MGSEIRLTNKGSKLIAIVLVVLVVAAGLGYWLFAPNMASQIVNKDTQQTSLLTSSGEIRTTSTLSVPTTGAPEISLEYVLTIQNPASGIIHVKCVVHNQQTRMTLSRGEAGGGRQMPIATNLTPEAAVISTLGTRFLESLSLPIGGQTTGQFEYDVDLSPKASMYDLHWYLDGRFGVVEPEYLFFFPTTSSYDRYLSIQNITIRFQIPDGWEVLTHWRNEGELYRANSTSEFIFGFLGFGRFDTVRRDIGGTNVAVASTGISETQKEKVSKLVFTLYEYYTANVGRISESTYLPRDVYTVLFVPCPKGRSMLSYREAAYGYFTCSLTDEPGEAHHIFHEWNGNSGAFFGDWFLTEGLTSYYEYHALLKTGMWSVDQYHEGLIWQYDYYHDEIAGTANDVPLEPFRTDVDGLLYYRKGAVVGYLLNEAMSKVTNGEHDMDDLMKYLFEHWATQKGDSNEWYDFAYHISGEELLKAVNEVTGHEFGAFFGAYVFGTDRLPLSVQGRQLTIRYEELPAIPELEQG